MLEVDRLIVEEENPPPSLEKARFAIINGVLTQGLIPASQLKKENLFHMRSRDDWFDIYLEGCVVRPPKSFLVFENFKERMFEVLYEGGRSILPVIIERTGEEDLSVFYSMEPEERKYNRMFVAEKKFAEKRMSASFLVVYGISTEEARDEFTTLRDSNQISAEAILCVIIPRDIYTEYVRFGGRTTKPVKVVDRTRKIKGLLGLKSNSFTLPDYEQALEEVVNQLGHSVWVHGVRLPADQEDLNDSWEFEQTRLKVERLRAEARKELQEGY